MKEIDKSSHTRADVFIFSENMDKALKQRLFEYVNDEWYRVLYMVPASGKVPEALLLVGYRMFEFSDSPEANVTPYLDNNKDTPLQPNHGILTTGRRRVIIPVNDRLIYKVSCYGFSSRKPVVTVYGAAQDIPNGGAE